MRFCSCCKRMYRDQKQKCDDCNKNLRDVTDINEPVRLCIVGGTQRAMLCGALNDAQIPYVEQAVMPMGVSNDIVTGYDVKLSNISLLVPYSAMPKAYDIACEIGVCDDTMATLVDIIRQDVEQYRAKNGAADEKPMSPAKRTAIKAVTAILFIIAVCAVVFGTDYIMELIKNLFGG